jgi:hypothetical protein
MFGKIICFVLHNKYSDFEFDINFNSVGNKKPQTSNLKSYTYGRICNIAVEKLFDYRTTCFDILKKRLDK